MEGIRLFRVAGLEIRMDWSLLIIFGLIWLSLSAGVFPSWHPDWSTGQNWLLGFAAAVLFFFSILLHEIAHALVGRRYGAVVRRITLFVFGGISHVEREPEDWKGGLWMALAGPLTSLAIGILCLLVGSLVAGTMQLDPERPQEALQRLDATATLLLWLGPINILLGIFNLIPGFPLDGGRVLLALIWARTGDRDKAMRYASRLGQGIGLALVAVGIAMALGVQIPVLGSGWVGGLWLVLIGWFLHNAALASRQQRAVERALAGVPVRELMQRSVVRVAPDTTIAEVVEQHLIGAGQRQFAVVENDRLVGVLTLEDLRKVPAEARQDTPVREVMTPRERLRVLRPNQSADKAMQELVSSESDQLAVMDGDRLAGLLTRDNLFTYLTLRGRPPRRAATER